MRDVHVAACAGPGTHSDGRACATNVCVDDTRRQYRTPVQHSSVMAADTRAALSIIEPMFSTFESSAQLRPRHSPGAGQAHSLAQSAAPTEDPELRTRACAPILPGAPTELVFGRLLHGRDVLSKGKQRILNVGKLGRCNRSGMVVKWHSPRYDCRNGDGKTGNPRALAWKRVACVWPVAYHRIVSRIVSRAAARAAAASADGASPGGGGMQRSKSAESYARARHKDKVATSSARVAREGI
jgi:hypothetical protein